MIHSGHSPPCSCVHFTFACPMNSVFGQRCSSPRARYSDLCLIQTWQLDRWRSEQFAANCTSTTDGPYSCSVIHRLDAQAPIPCTALAELAGADLAQLPISNVANLRSDISDRVSTSTIVLWMRGPYYDIPGSTLSHSLAESTFLGCSSRVISNLLISSCRAKSLTV